LTSVTVPDARLRIVCIVRSIVVPSLSRREELEPEELEDIHLLESESKGA